MGESSVPGTSRERLMDILSQLEERVEKLRKDASKIEEERENLLAYLDAFKHSELILDMNDVERENIQHSIDRLLAHCLTIETVIHINRNVYQEEALYKVNECIDNLVVELKNDPVSACERCLLFINSCRFENTDKSVSIDAQFESSVLECTIDDQKKIKKRLQGLLTYFTGVKFTEIKDSL